MAFVIKKKSERNGKTRNLYYLVENYRDGKKIKRRKVLALQECRSLAELHQYTKAQESKLRSLLERYEHELEEFVRDGTLPAFYIGYPDKWIQANIESLKDALAVCQQKIEAISSLM